MSSSFVQSLAYLEGTELGKLLVDIGRKSSLSSDPSDALIEKLTAQIREFESAAAMALAASEMEERREALRVAGLLRHANRIEHGPVSTTLHSLPRLFWGLIRFEANAPRPKFSLRSILSWRPGRHGRKS